MSDHRNLLAWREAMSLVEVVYRDTRDFPRDERFGLKAQIRRAAVSVPSNIAEGAGRNSVGELRQFVGVASGSLAELGTQLELAVRLGFLETDAPAIRQADRVGRLVNALRGSLAPANAYFKTRATSNEQRITCCQARARRTGFLSMPMSF
jgi:four helix bundle protein